MLHSQEKKLEEEEKTVVMLDLVLKTRGSWVDLT